MRQNVLNPERCLQASRERGSACPPLGREVGTGRDWGILLPAWLVSWCHCSQGALGTSLLWKEEETPVALGDRAPC